MPIKLNILVDYCEHTTPLIVTIFLYKAHFICYNFVVFYWFYGVKKMNLNEQRQWVLDELSSVADFWLKNGMDKVHGGVYTCLDKDGKVLGADATEDELAAARRAYNAAVTEYNTTLESLLDTIPIL